MAKSEIRELKEKLDKAIAITKIKYPTDKELVFFIKARDSSIHLSTSLFSKFKKAYKDVSPYSFKRVLKVLDEIIQEEFYFSWDETTKTYTQILRKEQTDEDEQHENSNRLLGLTGTYIGVSYNLLKSKTQNFYSYFKVRIHSLDKVVCQTERAIFKKGKMRLIGLDRIMIEISNDKRIIILIGNIGLNDNLTTLQNIKLGYVDSGDVHIKKGFAILFRTNLEYEAITPTSIEESDERMADFTEYTSLIKEIGQNVIPPSIEH